MSPRHGIPADPNDRSRKVRPAALPNGGVAVRSLRFRGVSYPAKFVPKALLGAAINEHRL
jgi:hypothetical protein